MTPGIVYNKPYSAEEFLKLVDSINVIYSVSHVGTGNSEFAIDVAYLNMKANIVRSIDMKKFWDICEGG